MAMRNLFPFILFIVLVPISFGQKVLLYTENDDVFASANPFTIEEDNVVFWQRDLVLMTIPIISLEEIRYAEKSYKPAGIPCVLLGKFLIATVLGASVAGQPDYILPGLSAGMVFYIIGRGLNFFGAKFGRDVIYYEIDQLDLSARKMILSSISMDLEKRKKHNYRSEFHYGPEGKKKTFLGFNWDGKKPWKNRKKVKKKILRFSFF